jgi:GNAT superfamily N-acetyltransferase
VGAVGRVRGLTVDAVALVRRLIRPVAWLIRPEWWVANVAALPCPGPEPPLPPGISVRAGSPADAPALAPLIRGRESLAWRFGRGDVVLIAELDGHAIGCTWLTDRPLRPSYFPIRVRPRRGEWYNYGLVVLPQHRVRGLGRALSRMAIAEATRRGGTRVSGHAVRFDRIAAASHAAAGFVTVEELIGVTLLNRYAVVVYRRPRRAPSTT